MQPRFLDSFRFLVKRMTWCTTLRFPFLRVYGSRKGQANGLFLNTQYAVENVIGPFLEGLQDKAGPLLFQFSPQDYSSLGDPEQFAERLHTFLAALPPGPLYAVEVRNPEVLTASYAQALSDTGACHCLNGHPRMHCSRLRHSLPKLNMPQALVIRWMLARHLSYEAARNRYAPFKSSG